MDENKKVLLISVGGTPEQTIKSIEFNNPEYVIFFCSKLTRPITNEIIKRFDELKIKDFERIITNNEEDIGKCYKIITQKLPEIFELWDITYNDIVVDYTGGTKTMTSALVLATIDFCNKYSYIGGTRRTKDGIGIVVNGSERFYYQENPWNELAVGQFNVIDSLVSKARYASACECLEKVTNSVDIRLKDIYVLLHKICMAYYEWDSFKHKQAKNYLQQSIPKFEKYSIVNNEYLQQLIDEIMNNFNWLSEMTAMLDNSRDKNVKAYKMLCIDLISNAVRRAEKENKYDDAVARLYSSIEKLAKSKLMEYGINNSYTLKEQIPTELEGRFRNDKCYDNKNKRYYYKYGFKLSCELLSKLDSEFGSNYKKKEKELDKLMNIRNNSILAHGINPVSKDLYKKMLKITLEFAQINKEELVVFPEFNLKKWGNMIIRG